MDGDEAFTFGQRLIEVDQHVEHFERLFVVFSKRHVLSAVERFDRDPAFGCFTDESREFFRQADGVRLGVIVGMDLHEDAVEPVLLAEVE